MTAAYRLKGLGWIGGCAMATLGFYVVSLQVATERKRLEQVEAKIAVADREIRALETEFDTRASLAQLERWNGEALALVAPGASQFVRSDAQLAQVRFDGAAPSAPAGDTGAIRTAALVMPAFTAQVAPAVMPVATPVAPVAPVASPTRAVTVAMKVPARPAAAPVSVSAPTRLATARLPAVTAPRRAAAAPVTAIVATVRPARATASPASAARKTQAVAMLDRSLLSDSTIGDLVRGARSEAGRLR